MIEFPIKQAKILKRHMTLVVSCRLSVVSRIKQAKILKRHMAVLPRD
ncbi:MAG: hypothetical protein ABSF26_29380 [Thermoguttaceae bacterium]